MQDDIPLPSKIRDMFPDKSLREIADILDNIPAEMDLTVGQGRAIIQKLLKTTCKDITCPRKEPTPHLKPARMHFKKGYEDVVVNTPPRRKPSEDWAKVEEQVAEWLKAGKVEKSSSPFNTPHVIAKKATPPYYRLAQDFRRLNRVLEPVKFPLRRLDEMTEETSNKRYKSGLDQDQAYTQIPIDKRDRPKTAFSTRNGKYHFCVMPYGLVTSGDVYCQYKHDVFSHDGGDSLLWHYIWSYVDDDAVGTNSIINHIFILTCVFERLLKFGMTLRIAKLSVLGWLIV